MSCLAPVLHICTASHFCRPREAVLMEKGINPVTVESPAPTPAPAPTAASVTSGQWQKAEVPAPAPAPKPASSTHWQKIDAPVFKPAAQAAAAPAPAPAPKPASAPEEQLIRCGHGSRVIGVAVGMSHVNITCSSSQLLGVTDVLAVPLAGQIAWWR